MTVRHPTHKHSHQGIHSVKRGRLPDRPPLLRYYKSGLRESLESSSGQAPSVALTRSIFSRIAKERTDKGRRNRATGNVSCPGFQTLFQAQAPSSLEVVTSQCCGLGFQCGVPQSTDPTPLRGHTSDCFGNPGEFLVPDKIFITFVHSLKEVHWYLDEDGIKSKLVSLNACPLCLAKHVFQQLILLRLMAYTNKSMCEEKKWVDDINSRVPGLGECPSFSRDDFSLGPSLRKSETMMDPLPPTLDGLSPWNEADTPRTHDLKHLRAKRVAYYESIGVIKNTISGSGSEPVSTESRDTKVDPSGNQTFGLQAPELLPHHLAPRKRPVLQGELRATPREAELCESQGLQRGPGTERCPAKLDFHLLADALVPEAQKLQHVIRWAQQFLSKPLENFALESHCMSGGFSQSSLGPSSNAVASRKNTHLKPSDCLSLPREDQSQAQTDQSSFIFSPQRNFSAARVPSELPGFFLKEGFPGSYSFGWPEALVRSEGEGRAASSSPDSLQLEDSVEGKSDRAEISPVHSPSEDETLSENLGVLSPLRLTLEESQALEETGQSPHANSYFWTPLTDSSEEEDNNEPMERKQTLQQGVLGRNPGEFMDMAWSPPSHSTLLSKPRVLSGISTYGGTYEVKEVCRGAAEHKDVTVDITAGSSEGKNFIQRLQWSPPNHSSSGRRKESDNVGSTLRSSHIITKHKKQTCNHFITERAEEIDLEKVAGSLPSTGSLPCSIKSSSSGMTWEYFDLTHPESDLAPQVAGLSLNAPEGPSNSAVFHLHLDTQVFRGPDEDTSGVHGSSGLEQLPPPELPGVSLHTAHLGIRETTQEEKEEVKPAGHPISRDTSRTALPSSSLPQEVGSSLPWSEATPCEPEQGASVLEMYFYYLHVLNKIRENSSEEKNSPLPFQGLRVTQTELVTTPPERKGGPPGTSRDRKTQGQREVSRNRTSMEGSLYSAACRMKSGKRSWEICTSACSSHKHGDVKSRSSSISRMSSAEEEKKAYMWTSPGAVEKSSCMSVLQDAERGMKFNHLMMQCAFYMNLKGSFSMGLEFRYKYLI
ncbi:uncharacterized protein LOC132540799 [Erinaceus europaeus]|uniref:Uncharacterized protein LOC132540799 n=1 Tax=Erinaceus europaeus TaxID=9365 RepID=A0ABM3Y1L7_ERIEU|nr:uncharacterized protein LOC132540799 [Erinaceus europaeus]